MRDNIREEIGDGRMSAERNRCHESGEIGDSRTSAVRTVVMHDACDCDVALVQSLIG